MKVSAKKISFFVRRRSRRCLDFFCIFLLLFCLYLPSPAEGARPGLWFNSTLVGRRSLTSLVPCKFHMSFHFDYCNRNAFEWVPKFQVHNRISESARLYLCTPLKDGMLVGVVLHADDHWGNGNIGNHNVPNSHQIRSLFHDLRDHRLLPLDIYNFWIESVLAI